MTYSQSDTKTIDSLVYTPKSLMGLMVNDLSQCDKDRAELAKTKLDMERLTSDLTNTQTHFMLNKSEITRLQNYNDSLVQQNLSLSVDGGKEAARLKKSRNWWVVTALAATVSAIAVHYHWKYANE